MKKDSSGFDPLFGGHRDGYGRFSFIMERTSMWSGTQADEDTTCAWYLGIFKDIHDVYIDYFNKGFGFHVRCLSD